MKTSTTVFFIFLLQLGMAQSPVSLVYNSDDNSMLWEISGNHLINPSYLFGTFHIICKDDTHPSFNLQQAIKKVDEVYFEIKLDDPNYISTSRLYINLDSNKTLENFYTPQEFKRLILYFNDSLKVSTKFIKKIRPELLQALIYLKFLNCKNVGSMEEIVVKIAKQDKKTITGLETIKFQSDMLHNILSPKEYAKQLIDMIDSLNDAKNRFYYLLNAYKTQSLSQLEILINEPRYELQKNKYIYLDDRNKNWINQVKTILKNKSVLIAVGTAHLLGDKGLIALLRQEGYTLKPLLNK